MGKVLKSALPIFANRNKVSKKRAAEAKLEKKWKNELFPERFFPKVTDLWSIAGGTREKKRKTLHYSLFSILNVPH